MKVIRHTIFLVAAAILLLTLTPVRAQDTSQALFLPFVCTSIEPTPSVDDGSAIQTQAEFEQAVLDALNIVRAENGLPELNPVSSLTQAARIHSTDMAQNSCFSHTGCLDGSSVGTRLTTAGYSWSRCGEIIAAGYSDADDVVEAWMNSDGHRAIILNASYVEFGAGWAYQSGSTYGTYWTVDFATPL